MSRTRTRAQAAADRASAAMRASLAAQLRALVEDAGLSQRELAAAAGLCQPYVSRILAGTARPPLETYARLATVLGADLVTRLYPNTGPLIRDRHQAAMLEALLASLHPRWHAFTEVAVRHPARGYIDVLLHDARAGVAVAVEIQSELRRLEQLIRWSGDKASSLPSWEGWDRLGPEPDVSRLLVVRRTRATQATAAEFGRQLRVAYPAHASDALEALTGQAAWPGAAMLWARRRGDGTVAMSP